MDWSFRSLLAWYVFNPVFEDDFRIDFVYTLSEIILSLMIFFSMGQAFNPTVSAETVSLDLYLAKSICPVSVRNLRIRFSYHYSLSYPEHPDSNLRILFFRRKLFCTGNDLIISQRRNVRLRY